MINMVKSIAGAAALVFTLAVHLDPAQAVPSLQLDIVGGSYDGSTETIVSGGTSFTLTANLLPDSKASLDDWYYISAAVTPNPEQNLPTLTNPDLGTFDFNGLTFDVTEDMRYGTPPYETYATQLSDPGDLPTHAIYDTYFIQFAFQFDPDNTALEYNTQDEAGAGPTPDDLGSMYFEEFSVDTSGLDPAYAIHFDLYNTTEIPVGERVTRLVCTTKRGKTTCSNKTFYIVSGLDIDIQSSAPFSHDAESGHEIPVPEPGALLLVGTGLLGLGLMRRSNKKIF